MKGNGSASSVWGKRGLGVGEPLVVLELVARGLGGELRLHQQSYVLRGAAGLVGVVEAVCWLGGLLTLGLGSGMVKGGMAQCRSWTSPGLGVGWQKGGGVAGGVAGWL